MGDPLRGGWEHADGVVPEEVVPEAMVMACHGTEAALDVMDCLDFDFSASEAAGGLHLPKR